LTGATLESGSSLIVADIGYYFLFFIII